MEDSFNKVFKDVKTVLCIMAHPDDTELYAGGTLARAISNGIRVVSVKMTLGEKGSRADLIEESKLKEVRKNEDSASMEVLGITNEDNIYLDLGDGSVENNMSNLEKLSLIFRKYQPDLMITHNPEDKIIRFAKDINYVNHRDHINTANLAIDAAYPFSRDRNFFPHQIDGDMKIANCTKFLLVDYFNHDDVVDVDVTDFVGKRIEAHAKHSSQYTLEDAKDSADFFTKREGTDRLYEKFRLVIGD